jgi:hypothetical protein
MGEPKRIRDFRLGLVKQIPKFPNNRASLRALQAMPLAQVLIHYCNWAIRYVPRRRRTVAVEWSVSADPRWKSLAPDIQRLLAKVTQGDDLTPHLSCRPHTLGFTPAASVKGPDVERWTDKDMLLNVMGFHHFHFDAVPHNQKRSDNVLFAHVTRDTFTVVGIFDHRVFEPTDPARPMTDERDRLWQVFHERTMRGAPPGAVIVQSAITTSGHPSQLVHAASMYARKVAGTDPQLDDPNYVQSLYQAAGIPAPANPKLRWQMYFLDLGIMDEKTKAFFCLQPSLFDQVESKLSEI